MGIDYVGMMNEAMLGFVARVLKSVQQEGLGGDQQIYITFITDFAGNELPDRLKEMYPRDMTIVLHYEFYNLVVNEDYFSVNLSFNNKLENIKVMFSSITTFVDPSEEFGLRFDPFHDSHHRLTTYSGSEYETQDNIEGEEDAVNEQESSDTQKVIDFSQFLKK